MAETSLPHNPDMDDEDVRVEDELETLGLFESTPWTAFITLCLNFTETVVLPLDGDLTCHADLDLARKFLAGDVTAKQLTSAQSQAWHRHDRLDGIAKDIQRLTLIFLYPDLLQGIESPEDPDSHCFLFLNLLLDIRPGLPTAFLDYVYENS